MKRALVLAAAFVLIAAAAAPAKKHTAPQPAGTGASIGQWHMKTDQLSANLRSGEFSAPDKVLLTRADGSTVEADRATGNYRRKQATLYGHVSVHDASGTFGLSSASQSHRGPATLTADQLQLDDTSHLYDASGNVHFEQSDTTADAQSAHLNDTTHELELRGKVHVVQGDRTLDAESVAYNTETGAGTADKNVTAVFPGITPSIATPKPIIIKGPAVP